MSEELYFRLFLTENEHYVVNGIVEKACARHGVELVYYRKIKGGHIPMQRECKVRAPSLGGFKRFLRDESLVDCMIRREVRGDGTIYEGDKQIGTFDGTRVKWRDMSFEMSRKKLREMLYYLP